jgi:hypothetical protein
LECQKSVRVIFEFMRDSTSRRGRRLGCFILVA